MAKRPKSLTDRVNKTIRSLSKQAQQQLETNQAGTGKLSSDRGVDLRLGKDRTTGQVKKISFRFVRNWVYVEKGARRGHGGAKGSTWVDRNGKRKRTNPRSLGKMNQGGAQARPWFDPVMKQFVTELTQEVASDYANISFERLKIKN